MNLRKVQMFLSNNFIFYLVGALAVLGVKYYYSQADCDSLLWILAPTTRWVELLSGLSFTYISGTGYVNHSLRLLIAPSCSGVRFMVITMVMLVFSFVHTVASPKNEQVPKPVRQMARGLGWIASSIAFSWIFTVLVNGMRIIAAIYLPIYLERAGLMKGMLTPERLHTIIGVVVYFTSLIMLYRLVDYVVQRKTNLTREYHKNKSDRIINGGIIDNKKTDKVIMDKRVMDKKVMDKKVIDDSVMFGQQFIKTLARKCVPPIFWYFFMTLGLPFLNRAYLEEGAEFIEFAALIIGCAALVILPYCVLVLLHSPRGSN